MTINGYPKLTIKGKFIEPLKFFFDLDFVAHAYWTQNNP